MAWHKTKKASKLPGMDKSKILVFDTETTKEDCTIVLTEITTEQIDDNR